MAGAWLVAVAVVLAARRPPLTNGDSALLSAGMETSDAPRWLDYLTLGDLLSRFDPRNPKAHDLDELRASMGRFGYTQPIEVDERTGLLVSGHGRVELLAGDRLDGREPPEGVVINDDDEWTVPTIRGWRSINDDEAGAYLVAANRLVERGGWLPEPLLDLLDSVNTTGLGLAGVGYSDDELARLVAEFRPPPPQPPDDFPSFGPDLPTQHQCPRCGYTWSGSSGAGGGGGD